MAIRVIFWILCDILDIIVTKFYTVTIYVLSMTLKKGLEQVHQNACTLLKLYYHMNLNQIIHQINQSAGMFTEEPGPE